MLRLLLILLAVSVCQASLAADTPPGRSAQTLWMLNCQGCHRADGSGTGSEVPAMPGIVARFLNVPGGREFLIRVPGVATSPLDDRSLALLVNWMLARFDPGHIPGDFTPFTAEEVSRLRAMGPYGRNIGAIRLALLKSFDSGAATER